MKEAARGGLQAFESATGLVKSALACVYAHSGTVEWDMLRQTVNHALAMMELEDGDGEDPEESQELSESLTEVCPAMWIAQCDHWPGGS